MFNRINSVRSYVTKERFVKTANVTLGICVYTVLFIFFIGIANNTLTTREYIGYALILGFFAGMINNIERVLRELFDKRKEE